MPENETTPNSVLINGVWHDTDELLTAHEYALRGYANTISDLRAEIEQLQEAVNDATHGGIATALEPTVERYARVNITKGAKGDYRHETTVTVTMTGGDWTGLQEELCAGLRAADGAARIEINQRISWDQHPHESDDDPTF